MLDKQSVTSQSGMANGKTANYFKQASPLIEEKNPMAKYQMIEGLGHAVISLIKSTTYGRESKTMFIAINLKNQNRFRVPDVQEFEKMLNRITEGMISKIKKDKNVYEIHSGSINFERVYMKDKKNIFIFEYRFTAKMKNNAENRPMKIVISDSEECDEDAFRLHRELSYYGKTFVSLKRKINNQI